MGLERENCANNLSLVSNNFLFKFSQRNFLVGRAGRGGAYKCSGHAQANHYWVNVLSGRATLGTIIYWAALTQPHKTGQPDLPALMGWLSDLPGHTLLRVNLNARPCSYEDTTFLRKMKKTPCSKICPRTCDYVQSQLFLSSRE